MAEIFLKDAYGKEPERPGLREDLSALLIFLGQYEDADRVLSVFRKANIRNQFLRVECLYRTGRRSEVEARVREYIPRDEENDSWELGRIEKRLRAVEEEASENTSLETCAANGAVERNQNFEYRCKGIDEIGELNNEPLVDMVSLVKSGIKASDVKGQPKNEDRIKSDDHAGWFRLGNELFYQGRYYEAEEAYLKAVGIKPDGYDPYLLPEEQERLSSLEEACL